MFSMELFGFLLYLYLSVLAGLKLQCYTLATGWGIEFVLKIPCFLYAFVQFQAGGDPKTGTVVSAQEAQAQAILQQTQVRTI